MDLYVGFVPSSAVVDGRMVVVAFEDDGTDDEGSYVEGTDYGDDDDDYYAEPDTYDTDSNGTVSPPVLFVGGSVEKEKKLSFLASPVRAWLQQCRGGASPLVAAADWTSSDLRVCLSLA